MIDFQGLLAVLDAAEKEPNLDMKHWVCATSHCMIGAFCNQNPRDRLYMKRIGRFDHKYFPTLVDEPYKHLHSGYNISTRFGITEYEAAWLFSGLSTYYAESWTNAIELNREQALTRLRKFIYYKLHKQEMIVEEKTQQGKYTRIIDQGRNISGKQSAVLAIKA